MAVAADPKNHHKASATEARFSGLHPNNSYPLVKRKLNSVEERKLQARQDSDFARGKRAKRPAFTKKGPKV